MAAAESQGLPLDGAVALVADEVVNDVASHLCWIEGGELERSGSWVRGEGLRVLDKPERGGRG